MMGSPGYVDISRWSPRITDTALIYRGTARIVTIPFAGGAIKHIEAPVGGKKKRG